MDGVTDAPMRFIAKKYGQADVIYTEFVSADGMWRLHKRGEMDHKIWKDLIYSEIERPVIAQIFGSDPEAFYESAKIICDLGFDGIDINMGCPSPGLEKRGGGAGLIRDKCNAQEVIAATRRGVEEWKKTHKLKTTMIQDIEMPVSVKTRIGSAEPDESWWKFLAEQQLPVVAMHGRTFKQLYKGEADWKLLLKAGEIIRESGAKFLGNGDVKEIKNSETQNNKVETQWGVVLKSGLELDLGGKMDGVLIGKESLGNPWILRKDGFTPTIKEKLEVMVEHAYKFEEIFRELKTPRIQEPKNSRHQELESSKTQKIEGKYLIKNSFQFFPMRKHLASYAKGFEGSVSLRKRLMSAEGAEQVEALVVDFLSSEAV